MEETEMGCSTDAGIITATQKWNNTEIASYSTS